MQWLHTYPRRLYSKVEICSKMPGTCDSESLLGWPQVSGKVPFICLEAVQKHMLSIF